MQNDRSIFLVGFMGAGKSSVGRALAARLSRDFIDLDDLIVERAGLAIPEIFARQGESYFRARETEALASLAARPGIVVALGGGCFVFEENRALIGAQGVSVWLDCALDVIMARVPQDGTRPLFNSPEQMAALLAKRRPAYEQADLRVDVSRLDIVEIVNEILSRFS